MRGFKYFIHNNYYVDRTTIYKIENDKKENKNQDRVYYDTYEEATEEVKKNLFNDDPTKEISFSEAKVYGKKLKTDASFASHNMYNVLKYTYNLTGMTINIGVIIWNKHYNVFAIKWIEEDKIKEISKVLPGLAVIPNFIEHYKKHYFDKVTDVEDLKYKMIQINRNSNDVSLVFDRLGNLYMEHFKVKEGEEANLDIAKENLLNLENCAQSNYYSYISSVWEQREEKL